jgi:hypothetical protein
MEAIMPLLKSIEVWGPSLAIRNSLFLFPMFEAIHVMGLAMVFGTIVVVDLRALGVASSQRRFNVLSDELLKWTWAAFVLTAATGVLMFLANPVVYAENTFFRVKLALLALAGANMMVFQFTVGRTAATWGEARSAPLVGKIACTLSLVLWISIIFMGRFIGFTTTGAAAKAEPPAAAADVNFDDFLGGDAPPSAPPGAAAPAAPPAP